MVRKALLAGVLGVVLASGSAFATNLGGCIGCEVSSPKKVEFGLDLKVDVDVCVDAGNIMGDYWSTQALIYQEGNSNVAGITQAATSDRAGIVQKGDQNTGFVAQNAGNVYGFVYQEGNTNSASITQAQTQAAAAIFQVGTGNLGTINQ